jgi:meiotically up-regulated gene 157 (Mug157) protein
MSQIMYALTSDIDTEIKDMIQMVKSCAVATGFVHESYNKNDSRRFTRAWFAWANTLFGELIAKTARYKPFLLS